MKTRLAGHGLTAEGAAYEGRQHSLPRRVDWGSLGGPGFALCACGARSESFPNLAARKAWHRSHTDAIAATVST